MSLPKNQENNEYWHEETGQNIH
jgi:hypothetical protein